jgi:hypothetical protein
MGNGNCVVHEFFFTCIAGLARESLGVVDLVILLGEKFVLSVYIYVYTLSTFTT